MEPKSDHGIFSIAKSKDQLYMKNTKEDEGYVMSMTEFFQKKFEENDIETNRPLQNVQSKKVKIGSTNKTQMKTSKEY